MSATGTKATAASPYKVHITPKNTGLLNVTQTEEVAEKASTLLQEDLEAWTPSSPQFTGGESSH